MKYELLSSATSATPPQVIGGATASLVAQLEAGISPLSPAEVPASALRLRLVRHDQPRKYVSYYVTNLSGASVSFDPVHAQEPSVEVEAWKATSGAMVVQGFCPR